MKRFAIRFNAPVVLSFAILSLLVLVLDSATGGASTARLFCVYRAPLTDPLTYVRFFTHVLGHSGYSHYMSNMLLPGGRTAILEIKTTNYNAKDHWWSEDGQEIVPLNYEAQGRHYMSVMNIDEVFYCCLYGNNEDEVIIRHIDRDRDYEAELIALERDFWENHILTGMPPPYTEDGDLILNSVRRHFGPADPSAPELILEGNMALLITRYLELQTQRNAEKRNYEHIEAGKRCGMSGRSPCRRAFAGTGCCCTSVRWTSAAGCW